MVERNPEDVVKDIMKLWPEKDLSFLKTALSVVQSQDEKTPPLSAETTEILKKQVKGVLSSLSERERRVIVERLGLEDGRSRTLKEVGRGLNVSASRIWQIEAKALRKLRHSSEYLSEQII